MKKIFLALFGILMWGTATVSAHIWGAQLILRGGFAANNFKGDYTRGIDRLPSYNFSLDFNKTFYRSVYWNTGVMFGTRGFSFTHGDNKLRAHNLYIPFTVGCKYNLTDNLALDGRFGGFFGVDMAGRYSTDHDHINIGDITDYKRCDGGIIVGLGIWYKRINIDYMFKRGFGEVWSDGPSGAVHHVIRLGYAF